MGDRYFYHPLYETVNQHLGHPKAEDNPIYLIKFDYQSAISSTSHSTVNDSAAATETKHGIVHGDDLAYYFTKPAMVMNKNTLDRKMSQILIQTIVHFATTNQMQQWQSFDQCTNQIATPICDYQVFQKFTAGLDANRILIGVKSDFDLEMVKFWKDVVDNNFQ